MFQTDPGRTRDDPGRTRDFRERLEVGAMLLEFGTDPPRNRPCRCRYATLHPPRIIVLARPDKTGRTATESIDRTISNDRWILKKNKIDIESICRKIERIIPLPNNLQSTFSIVFSPSYKIKFPLAPSPPQNYPTFPLTFSLTQVGVTRTIFPRSSSCATQKSVEAG